MDDEKHPMAAIMWHLAGTPAGSVGKQSMDTSILVVARCGVWLKSLPTEEGGWGWGLPLGVMGAKDGR